MKATVVTIKGEETEKMILTEKLFGAETNPKMLAQAVRVYLSNQRQGSAKTKTRGEVKKTTAKMYKQKGTGRARHGSYAAPIFVGGGIAHGPSGDQNYKLKMTATLRKLALINALSDKAHKSRIVIISEADKASGKTSEAKKILIKTKIDGSTLTIVSSLQNKLLQELKNLEKMTVVKPNQLNAYIIVQHNNLFITPEAIKELEKIYVN